MTADTLIVFVARYLFLGSIALIPCAAVLDKGRAHRAERWAYFALTVSIAGALGFVGGHLYYHARPFVVDHTVPLLAHAADNGFPSDHALLTAAIAAGIWKSSRPLSAIGWAIAIAVGTARVLAGIHWPMDVIGGLLMAVAAGAIGSLAIGTVVRRPSPEFH